MSDIRYMTTQELEASAAKYFWRQYQKLFVLGTTLPQPPSWMLTPIARAVREQHASR